MGEDIQQKVSNREKMNAKQLQGHVENSVLLPLKSELHELITCLEIFGLPCPQRRYQSFLCQQYLLDLF